MQEKSGRRRRNDLSLYSKVALRVYISVHVVFSFIAATHSVSPHSISSPWLINDVNSS